MGASLGTALLNTIAATTTAAYLAAHVHRPGPRSVEAIGAGLVHGYTTAAGWAAAILVAAAVTVGLLVNATRPEARANHAVIEATLRGTSSS